MKILQTSDTHIGITSAKQLDAMFAEAAKEDFDVLVHCGDWCGTRMGNTAINRTLKLIRKHLPDKPIVATIGNHDYWCRTGRKHPGVWAFNHNLRKIKERFAEHKVHWLDEDGIFRWDATTVLFGVSGWYSCRNPNTNDKNFLPIGLFGDTNAYLEKLSHGRLLDQTALLNPDDTNVFVSHFPVIDAGPDYKGSFADFNWNARIGDWLYEDYGVRYFLCGHAHRLHKGPWRWECGPDYHAPRYQLIEV